MSAIGTAVCVIPAEAGIQQQFESPGFRFSPESRYATWAELPHHCRNFTPETMKIETVKVSVVRMIPDKVYEAAGSTRGLELKEDAVRKFTCQS